mgnify:CR=1 FL=1|jgi:hypothetical protein
MAALRHSKDVVKGILGEVPYMAELYWLLRQRGQPIKSRFSLKGLQNELPGIVAQAKKFRQTAPKGRKIFIFSTLHYWIEHSTLLGLTLAGQGHDVTLAYLPYADWQTPVNKFDLKRQNVYALKVLKGAESLINVVPFFERCDQYKRIPPELQEEIELVTNYDTQYTLGIEEVDTSSEIYQFRLSRNRAMACSAMDWMQVNQPDSVIVPNGTIQELGIAYRVACHLGIPVTTYEFGDQRERIWVGQNQEVMRQDTKAMWEARRNDILNDAQLEQLESMFSSRRQATVWKNFGRQWQGVPTQGGAQVRADLGLDDRPVVLLATNVLGDSLTIGRQNFSASMAEWISRTVQYFSGKADAQLVIRVHPGEVLTRGLSMADVVRSVLPNLPENIHLIEPREQINTYDLVEIADVGLVYTTTVGLEMAMLGKPVIVSGNTHYRGRGFTHDPNSWKIYYKILGRILEDKEAHHLTNDQIESAWRYAYYFFFHFARPFPWHLVRMWDDYKSKPLEKVLNPKGLERYGETLRYLAGEAMDWELIE